MTNMDHHPGTVDILDLQTTDLADPEASGISCGQRYTRLETGDGLKKLGHLVRRQNNGDLAGFARVWNPLRDIVLGQGNAIEKSESTHDLI